jgi:hypothetical protein
MSTPNFPDDELDDFFRKSLGNPNLDFREEDWQKMEQKLKDKKARERAAYRRFLYSLLGLLLIIVPVLTWYFILSPAQTAKPAVAIREKTNTENNAGTANTPNVETPSGSALGLPSVPSVAEKEVSEKSDEDRSDVVSSSSNKIEQMAKKGVSKPKQLLIQEPLEETKPSARQETASLGKPAKEHADNEKESNAGKTAPVQPGLLFKKPESPENIIEHKKVNNKNRVNKSLLTRSQQDNPAEKLPSNDILNKTKSNKQLSELNYEKGRNNTPVPEKKVADDNTWEEAKNNTNKNAFGIFPGKNSRGNDNVIQKEVNLSEEKHSSIQVNNIFPIEAIPGFSTRPLSYETQLTDLIGQQINSIVKSGQIDSTRRQKLAIERMRSRISANLLISPDLSSIGFSEWRAPGTNLGVSLEYHISNRVSISVGAIYSTKIYAADATKYNPDNPYWTSYYPKPVDVKGNCKVIDLPLNIRYNFLTRERYNIYLSGGLSSYLMLREDYKYIYNVDDTGLYNGWHGKNENKHFFKVINLSAGYERKLNQRFSLQAEPFIKLPTAGVGYGRIKLLSTGLFMAVKYNF